jgi:hypothetical protein
MFSTQKVFDHANASKEIERLIIQLQEMPIDVYTQYA